MSALNDLVNQVLAEAAQLKAGVVEKTAAAIDAAPVTETGHYLRKLAAELRTSSSNPSYEELNAFLGGH